MKPTLTSDENSRANAALKSDAHVLRYRGNNLKDSADSQQFFEELR